MNGFYSILFLIIANVFMTLAWYGHLRFAQWSVFQKYGLVAIVLVSWGIALIEYMFQVPANKLGYIENGGPFTLFQLKIIQEVISLIVFTLFAIIVFKNETFRLNHFIAFIFLMLATYFIFKD